MAHASFKLHGKQFAAFDLSKPLLIGRSIDCDLSVQDTSLSRRHIRLEPDGDGWHAVDLNSSNGTYVEGERVARRRLEDGDLIQAGPLSITFHDFRPPTLAAIAFTQQIVIDPNDFELSDEIPVRPAAEIAAGVKKSIDTVVDVRQRQWAELASQQEKPKVAGAQVFKDRFNRIPMPVGLGIVAASGFALFLVAFELTNWIAN